MEDTLLNIVTTINNYLSDYILVILLIGCGLYFSIRTKFVQVRCFGEGMRKVFGNFTMRGKKHELFPGAGYCDSGAGRYRQYCRRMRRDTCRRPGRYLLDVDYRIFWNGYCIC